MAANQAFQSGNPVRVRGCEGLARIESYILGYDVYLLDRPLSHQYRDKESGVVHIVSYWTFEKKDLIKVDLKGG